ncbi:MAG TPA: DNA-3-methyladenine glycosylase 2 family protein [Burkholderiales bacterium]|nr:DNA-3-methyladenine glycosylase 2 family protein [Burkholderiales bacterium]
MTIPSYWKQASRELANRDRVLRRLIKIYGGLSLRSRGNAFMTLARSIVGQQISLKAADSVWQKLLATVPAISPIHIASADGTKLRNCGLSGKKVLYLQDLARSFVTGTLDVSRWNRLDDDELIAELTLVKGIGRWTAEMFLIFYMMRPDVLPLDDLGLQRAMSTHYNNDRPLSKLKMRSIANNWVPWRSVATWYLWRSLDPIPVEY